jgi:hypothetical protein
MLLVRMARLGRIVMHMRRASCAWQRMRANPAVRPMIVQTIGQQRRQQVAGQGQQRY